MTSRSRSLWIVAMLGGLASLGYGLQAGVLAQVPDQAGEKEPTKPKMQMMCPMMAAMQGVEFHAASPTLLLAQADQLDLSEQQKDELQKIAARARRQARNVLSAEQQQQLAQAPEGPLSMMEVAKLRIKDTADDAEQMCPMCMKMMQQKERPKRFRKKAPQNER